jgi:hypothetical protein
MTQIKIISSLKSFTFMSKVVTIPTLSEMNCCWLWCLIESYKWWLISYIDGKSQSHFSSLSSASNLSFSFKNVSISYPKIKTILLCSTTQPQVFFMVQEAPIFSKDFQWLSLKMAIIKSKRLNRVHNRNHKFHSRSTFAVLPQNDFWWMKLWSSAWNSGLFIA